ncbi:MAG: hypothetical protein NWE83_07990 [Candidatus Bathyarchaeota archaeon]|nr:hypothetical protein [Candidatus Bathyarchaeota archaeon]
MRAEDKLAEAKYFLSKIDGFSQHLTIFPYQTVLLKNEFKYNFSAFVQAWRSTFDFLLYDYAEKYFDIDPEEDSIDKRSFTLRAVTSERTEAATFIKWYNKKEGFLGQEHLWYLRNISIYRGGRAAEATIGEHISGPLTKIFDVSVLPSNISADTVAPDIIYGSGNRTITLPKETKEKILYSGKYDNIEMLDMCQKGYNLMAEIVTEARDTF